ncbi:MAG: SPOR domain-containing protein, partial [Clostridia bacterium]|nr:SPOR domain-containing protein [Clostridia bacterium]
MMKHKLIVKVMVWILAILMLLGCCTAILSAFVTPTYAAEAASDEYVTVGLMYGSDVTVGFETVTTVGFDVYSATLEKTERSYEKIYSIDLPKVTVVCDDNLSQTAYTYSIYNTSKKCVVGGYHVEVADNLATLEEAEAMLAYVQNALKEEGSDMHPFIAYINGAYKIRIGDYSSEERIASKIKSVPNLAAALDLECAVPSSTCVMVVDPLTNVIYFEYD